ncbi:MAG: hypothetical protein A2Y10_00080 [Planctomycetes bacterium GWF2_41_51]|nr:MAG: hypothetical protein A2Y10_00080 [Planctomycetes bacterium GWF2_41_51]HBG28638.1 hypothetical protein [Phycisphaerales bacterium]
MKRKYFFVILTLKVFIFSTLTYGQILYDIINLGTGVAYSVNNNGQIVGYSANGATLFDTTGNHNNIILGPGIAYSINDNSQIVGYSSTDAMFYDNSGNGQNINLGTGIARSINNKGQIVGNSSGNAIIFDPIGSGNNINLGNGLAYSINDNGQIVGRDSDHHPVIFSPDYITLSGKYIPLANNNYGQIVGGTLSWGSNDNAVLFDSSGGSGNIVLGTGIARDINNNGQIVGNSDGGATLFDPSGGGNNIALNSLIAPDAGWDLRYAYAINDNGWIVGYGHYGDSSDSMAFLLKPIPEPATIILFAFGGLMFPRKKEQRKHGIEADAKISDGLESKGIQCLLEIDVP